MKWWLLAGIVGLAFSAGTGNSAKELPPRDARNAGWFTDYTAAKMAARQSGKPLLVVFR